MADSKFILSVEEACESELVAVGFKRLRKGRIVREIYPDFLGWVGLNKGNHGSVVRINPFVGIHATAVMKLCAALEEEKYVKGEIATYAIHLGELLPDELTFEFHVGRNIADEAGRLAGALAGAGAAYMQAIADYEALLPLVEARMPMLGGYPERFVSILHLSGRTELAKKFVEGVLCKHGELAKYSTAPFLKFGKNFLTMST